MQKKRANVFHGPNDIRVEEVPRPIAGAGDAVIRITLTTICGTDLHILRGEYPVRAGLVIGHEPVGVIEEIGEGVTGYKIGDRVLVGAITPCGQCRACLSGQWAQCGHGEGVEAIGGWRFGNTINGAQAEYLLVPNAQANLAKIPDQLSDEQVVLLADIASTGFSGAESAGIRIGDTVVEGLPIGRVSSGAPYFLHDRCRFDILTGKRWRRIRESTSTWRRCRPTSSCSACARVRPTPRLS